MIVENNGRIDREKASELHRNFGKWIAGLPQDRPIQYANNTWFEINKLESFIKQVKEEAQQIEKEVSGIRVYFASYDVNDGEKLSVFLSPTEAQQSEKSMAFNTSSVIENDSDIAELGVLNFGSSGYPPGKDYPYTNE